MRTLTRGRFRLLLDYHRIPDHTEQSSVAEGPCIVRTADDVAEHYAYALSRGLVPRDREAFCAILLNARHNPIALHVVSIGSLNSAPMHPREVFRPAIAAGAAALIVAHHHPSGDPKPSVEDQRVTDRLREAGTLLGIEVLDHIVIGLARFWSFADASYHQMPRIQTR